MSDRNVFWERTARALLALAAVVVFFRYLLTPLLPFLLALALCAVLEPGVARLSRRLKVKRSFAAAALVTALLLVVGGALAVLALGLILELQSWSEGLPTFLESFPSMWNGAIDHLEAWYSACPVFLRSALDGLASQLTEEGETLAGQAAAWAMGVISQLLAALPSAGLFLVTTVLAVYFTAIGYPAILAFLKRQLPQRWQVRCRQAARCFRSTMLKWLRSELLLIFVTFLILLGGFTWMGSRYALLAAAGTALVDALPVLGTGTVLLPWAAGCLLLGNGGRALALTALYAVATLTHSLLEPRLLAGQVGLPPITALLAMYVGFHFMGVGGMLLLPILLLLVKQLGDCGVVRLWK
jgi:sporulation integral membrane protein YtvI